MAGDWETVELGEVAAVRSGYAFKSSDWTDSGIPVVKIANVKGGRLEMSGCSYVEKSTAAEAREFQLTTGDILIAMTGYIGDVARVRKTDLPCVLNQRVGKFSVRDTKRLDADFLYTFLAWAETRLTIEGLGYGSAQPNVSPSLIHKVELPLPPLAEQKAIAAVIGALDDKIELNRRMNATLEAMARALFQSWFVDFDPVRAKLDGRQPVGMDRATAALFPEYLEDSPLGHIPKGWKAGTVVEGFHLTMGQSPPGDTYNEDGNGLPFYQGRTDFGFRFPTRRIYCSAPTRYAKPGDTLVSVRAPVGDINMANEECCIGRGVAAVRHKSGAPSFTYHSMANLNPDFARFEAEGTVFGSINKDSFEQLPFVIPPEEILAAFERQAGPLDEQVRTLDNQSRTLATLRDTLLPMLLSGELRIREVNTANEVAV